MKVYLVGGAVRDSLLEIPFKERDYVVVGSSPEELSSKGYMPVGSQFPVFLHPETKEEYALARTERKSGKGHKGFVFHTDTSVTLEEDLVRRDITINAIAQDSDGRIIDPYGGQKDIHNKLIKKVSEAFEEDPLRVYRVSRFAAKLKYLDFKVEKNTLASMNEITLSGELDTLPKERIWMETAKALDCKNPEVYFELLKECGALEKLIGKIDLDTKSLKIISDLTEEPVKKWAALLGNQNNPTTVNSLFSSPKYFGEISLIFSQLVTFYGKKDFSPEIILEFIKKTDAVRREERFFFEFDSFQLFNKISSFIDWKILLKRLNQLRPEVGNKSGQEISKELHNKKIETIFQYLET